MKDRTKNIEILEKYYKFKEIVQRCEYSGLQGFGFRMNNNKIYFGIIFRIFLKSEGNIDFDKKAYGASLLTLCRRLLSF